MPIIRPRTILLLLLSTLTGPALAAAEIESLPRDRRPLLRVDPGGPASFVTALAFSPDGKTLYAAGWDKVIRVWMRNDRGVFEPSRAPFRVPVGPGPGGAINALALSPDGEWLAAAGNGVARQIAGFRQLGFIVPTFGSRDPVVLRDIGTIYLFNTRDRSVRLLRGHLGYVAGLTFGPSRGKSAPRLLSAAMEEKPGTTVKTQLTARLWDLDKGESVAVLSGLPSSELAGRRPGLALWQDGDDADSLKAALALHDGNLHLWEPIHAPDRVRTFPDLRANLSVAHLGRGRLLTAGYHGQSKQSYLARWKVPDRGEPERDRWGALGSGFARSLALLSRKGDGVADLAGVLVLVPGTKGASHQYRLCIADLTDEDFRVVKDVLLWRDRDLRQAPVAASLRGEHVAVAGNADHSIHVYSIRRLLTEDKATPQILRGDAVTFRHASFVRRGKELGLLLNRDLRKDVGELPPEPDKQKGDWVFDFGKRRLSEDLTDWSAERPDLGRWSTRLTADRRTVQVSEADRLVQSISIAKTETAITDYALLPTGSSVKVPLLAVALHQNGEPRLTIYHAKTGEPLRQFTGHTERLRSLAFAPDGRLLVSTAEDGTVCVWSLTDLDTIVGKHGRLPGVTVGPAGKGSKGAKVLEVENDSPAAGKLRPGDLVTVLEATGKKPRRIESPLGFYEALYELPPGTKVNLRRGDPDGDDNLAFVVGQGIDERKPLFSLFVIGAARAADCEWIGWNPIGPYEASSPRADKHLGWHFNTGDPRAPTRFANAGQYRKEYYRENLLEQLIQRGALGLLDPPRLPPPVLGAWVEEEGRLLPQREHEGVIVRRPRIQVRVAVQERPLFALSALTWRLDGGAETPLDLSQPGEASFQVPLTLPRGEHRFVVTARPREGSLEPTRKWLTVRYQPPAPEIVSRDAGRQQFVRQADFTLRAAIKLKNPGEDVRITIRHQHDEGQEKPHTLTLAAREAVEGVVRLQHSLKLHPGNNVLEVIAVNAGAPEGDREAETDRKTLPVFYHFKAGPPAITFQKVTPVAGDAGEAAPVLVASGSLVVRQPVVDLVGQIKAAEEPLIEALWDRGKTTKAARLDRFEPGKHAAFAFEQRITLEPGRQTIRVRARTKHSDEVEHHLVLDYQPPVPLIAHLTAPREGEVLEGSEETKTIPVRAEIRLPRGVRPYTVVIHVNGKPAAQRAVVEEKTGTVTGRAVIEPGENRIWIEVRNEWGASSTSEVVAVRYVRPPIFVGEPGYERVPGRAFVHLKAQVLSATPLERESVHVEINRRESPPGEIHIEAGEKNHWTLRLVGVPLDAGSREQIIVLRLGNREALCRAPGTLRLRSESLLPAPEVEFVDPRQDMAVPDARLTVRFRVRSASKLEHVRLLQAGRPPVTIPVGGARSVGNQFELLAETQVDLAPGPNHFSVDAVSVGGRLPNRPPLVVTYSPPPLRIVIDQLAEFDAEGTAVKPQRQQTGKLVFPKVTSGRVWLHGRISWTDSAASAPTEAFLLRVFVNGFQQMPYKVLRKGNEKETPFEVRLVLNRRTSNRISLVAFPQDAGSPAEAWVDCARPITAQRLHILALSPHSQPEEVKQRLNKAIEAARKENATRGSAFQEPDILPPLTEARVSVDFLRNRLYQFKEKIRHGRDQMINEVLLLYYEGEEKVDPRGHFFETYSPSGPKQFEMPCDKLVSSLVDVPGAHLLLLDVDRSALSREDRKRDEIAGWKDSHADEKPHVVVMRCAHRVEAGRPNQVRLIPVLQKQLPQAARLSKLIPLIEEALATASDHHLLVFTKYLPPELADLALGSAP